MEGFLNFLVMLAFGGACAAIGSARGRSPVAWFFLGFIFSCLALVLLLVLPDLQEQQDREEEVLARQRRLAEELAQERSKNQSFRGHVKARLDVHDAALGVDTREQTPAQPAELPPPPPVESVDAGELPERDWYVAEPGGEAEGPFSVEDLKARFHDGRVSLRSLVWNAEFEDDWQTLRDTPLRGLLA